MNIGIFGYNGFIGTNLCSTLDFEVKKISLRNPNWNITTDKLDVYINLVGKAHDHTGIANEKDYYHANLDLGKEIFKEYLASDACVFIHISSIAAVEELESSKPLSEENSCNPQSFYGKSKREMELWLLNQKLPSDKKIFILRPSMVHGKGDKGNLGLLYKFISKGIPYPLSSFNNKRSFISIDNFSFLVNKIIKEKDTLHSGIFHLADDESVNTKEIIGIISSVCEKKIMSLSVPPSLLRMIAKLGNYIPIPLNTNRLKKMTSNLEVSNQKIKKALGIEKLPLTAKEGLQKTIRSFQKI